MNRTKTDSTLCYATDGMDVVHWAMVRRTRDDTVVLAASVSTACILLVSRWPSIALELHHAHGWQLPSVIHYDIDLVTFLPVTKYTQSVHVTCLVCARYNPDPDAKGF